MSTQNDPVPVFGPLTDKQSERVVNTLFGKKPVETYAIYSKPEGGFRVVEFTVRDGQTVQTERTWDADDIFLARGHVPPLNRVQVKPDPAHDSADLIETWV